MPIIDNPITLGARRMWRIAGSPSDGASGTLYNRAEIGDLLADTTNKLLYQNRGTKASPTWTEIAGGGVAIDTVVGNMAANGTSTANAIGSGPLAAPVDHVHKIGTHDHSDATKGSAIVIAALGADFFAASATPRATFQADFFDATTVADLFAANSFTNAILDSVIVADSFDNTFLKTVVNDDALDSAFCDAAFAANAFAADTAGRAPFATGIWLAASLATNSVETAKIVALNVTSEKCEVGLLSADSVGRALMSDGFFTATEVLGKFGTDSFDSTACDDIFADNAIPTQKINWSYGAVGDITALIADASNAAGTEAGVARVDHGHAITCATPSGDCAPDGSNTEGSADTFVRSDHIHAMPCGAPVDGSLAAANAEGSGVTFARLDHAHKAILADDVDFIWGAGTDCAIRLSTANDHASGNQEELVIALSDLDEALHITDLAAIATDWNLAATTDPTVYIHSNTTPITDYLLMYHDATDGIIDSMGGNLLLKDTGVELVSLASTKTFFNEPGADIDFQISSNDVAAMFVLDGALNVLGIGAAASAGAFVKVASPAKTLATAAEFAAVHIEPAGATTTFADSSTYDYIASVYIAEPNIVKGAGDTITIAATVYIKDAPTEGSANYAVYIASGAVGVQALTAAGLVTASAGIAMADQKLDFTTGYIEFNATNPAASGNIRVPNNDVVWVARNQAAGGDISGWKVNATDDYEAAADVNLAGNLLYGGVAANADLDLNATINGTVATAYIIARQTLDCTVGMVATLVKAGAIGDAEGAQTDINGEMGIDSVNGRFYFRYGAAWHYCTQDAGFAFPEYERTCPICGKEIAVGDSVVGVVNEIQEDGARHGLYCHASCVGTKTNGISLPKKVTYEPVKGKVNPSARERMLVG